MTLWEYVAATLIILSGVLGVVITALTLPGLWLTIAVAALCKLWHPEQIAWTSLIIAISLGVLAELIEFFASALGAAKVGGSRRGAIGATVGGLIGALVGAVLPPPIIACIIGASVGAGLGAFLAERTHKPENVQTYKHSAKVGAGAAVGRLVATVAKVILATIIAIILAFDAFL